MSASGGPRLLSRPFGLAIRLAIAGGLTAYLFWKIHPREVLAAAAAAHWGPIGIAVLLVLVDRSLMAYRWMALLCTIEPWQRPPLSTVMRIFFVSTFLGTFLPASVGGDAVRSYSMLKLNVAGSDAVASVFMDRMLGVASVLLMAVVGLFFARDLATNTAILAGLSFSTTLCLLTMFVIFSRRGAQAAVWIAALVPIAAVQGVTARLVDSIRKYAGHPGSLVKVLLCSVLVQVLRILQAYCLGLGLDIAAPLTAYFALIPLILLVMLLPVTFNGIGTGQAAFIWAFRHAGVPDAAAFALSVLFVGLGIVGNLPGALLFASGSAGEAGPGPRRPDPS